MQGRILAQRYRLLSQLGQGGMGSVWRAQHLELGTPTAIKLISPEIAANPEALARFKREAQAAATLRSPHVVQILDYGVDGDTPFIAMELLEGESLQSRLERRGRLSLQETASVLSQVARAVGKAHAAGVVHRDLKPDNIFLVHNEDDEVAKVLDFGIAKTLAALSGPVSMSTGTGVMLGTPYYMSPEQAAGKRQIDHRTDVWALAIIAYQCLTGARPFHADTLGGLVLAICTENPPLPSSVLPGLAGFDQWFLRSVDRDPDRRFQSVREQAEQLRILAGAGQPGGAAHERTVTAARQPSFAQLDASTTARQAGPTSLTIEPTSAPRKHLVAVAVVSVALLLMLGAIGYSLLQNASSPAAALASQAPVETAAVAPPDPAEPAPIEQRPPDVALAGDVSVGIPPEPERTTPPSKSSRKTPRAEQPVKSARPAPKAAPVAPSSPEAGSGSGAAPVEKPKGKPAAKPPEGGNVDLAF